MLKIPKRIRRINRINIRQIKAFAKNAMTDNQYDFPRISLFQQSRQANKRAATIANIINDKTRFALKINDLCIESR